MHASLAFTAVGSLVVVGWLASLEAAPLAHPGLQDSGQQTEVPPDVDPQLLERLNIEPALREAEGVLGVRSMRWKGEGREALFAWFEDAQALLDWYFSAEHLDAADAILSSPLEEGDGPLAHLPEDSGPLLVIFYIAGNPKKPTPRGLSLPLSAFSIEIYTPAPGGITLVDGFAPRTLKIPHHRRLLSQD